MKKFLVFCLILIVSASLGVTVFYFMRNNEELVVNAEPYMYVNQGDLVEIDATLKHAKMGNEVVFTSLNENVLQWNPALNGFEAIQGGLAIVEVKTNNINIPSVLIEVSVGNGMMEAPFYIDSEEDLLNIGEDIFNAESHYILMQDITLTNAITPLLNENTNGFAGSLNGNGFSIKDLNISTAEGVSNAGLFSKIASTGVVTNLTLENVTINGQFANAGSIAGVNYGTITRCNILNGSVVSTLQDANVGGIAGSVIYSNSNVGRIDRCYTAVSVNGTKNVGGLTGKNEGGILINSYVSLPDTLTITGSLNGAYVGGLVGLNANYDGKVATIKNCYSKATVLAAEGVNDCKVATLIGFNDEISINQSNNLMGVYVDNTTVDAVNHEFNRTFTSSEIAEQTNFRGVYNSFPKDGSNNIIAADMKSYVASTATTSFVTWDFVNVWQIDKNINNGYPTLNNLGANVADDIAVAYNPGLIRTAEDLYNMATAVNNGTASSYYVLDDNIDLTGDFTPIGTAENPFTGTFEGNGKTIKGLKVTSTTINNMGTKYAGLFGKISSSASIKNVTIENVIIEDGATYAGAVVGYSEGNIENVKVTKTALNKESNTISGTYSVGGIAGISFGLINNCKVTNQTIVIKTTDANASRFAGGIAGLNGLANSGTKATISNSSVVTSYIYDNTQYGEDNLPGKNYKFSEVLQKTNFFVGGISGANYYKISTNYVYNSDLEISIYASKGGVAGIVGLSKSVTLRNEGVPSLNNNKVIGGTIKGYLGAGIVNHLYDIAHYNEAQIDTIYGFMLGGLANDLKLDSRLYYGLSKSHFVDPTGRGECAGVTNDVRYSHNTIFTEEGAVYGEFKYIFSACTFDSNNGHNRYDATAYYRMGQVGYVYSTRIYGYGNNFIWVNTGHANWDGSDWFGINGLNYITSISPQQATFIDDAENTIALFTSYGFDTETWSFETMSYPKLLNMPEIEEQE